MKKNFFLYLLLVLPIAVFSNNHVIYTGRDAGMFSNFFMVLSLCEAYDKKVIQGAEADFSKQGYYYDRAHGPNWWQYYFEPLNLGSKKCAKIFYADIITWVNIEYFNTRQENYNLIKKYIKVKSHIKKKVDDFTKDNFKGHYIIGIHYRGTDKCSEAKPIDYKTALAAIIKHVKELNKKKWKIFLATDAEPFVKFLEKAFPGKICYQAATRSANSTSLHVHAKNPYKQGEEALIDCLLLSKTNILIRTTSNLSQAASHFNPNIREIVINQRKRYPNFTKIQRISRTDPRYFFKNLKLKKF